MTIPVNIDQAVPKAIFSRVAKAKKRDILGWEYPHKKKLERDEYEAKKLDLQIELLKMERWIKDKGKKVVMLFEGRDAGGKGGTIKRFTEHMNPRGARVVALEKPDRTELGQWYFQRYIQHLPTDGEIVFFDRSWYNRAVVEPVMGFCTPAETRLFLKHAPILEKMLIENGFIIYKFWFSVSRPEQFRRFKSREEDKLKQWKLSPVDLQSLNKWNDYSRSIDKMFEYTDTPESPWLVVRSDDKKRARLNCIMHVLHTLPYPGKNTKVVRAPEPRILGPAKTMYESFAEKKSNTKKKSIAKKKSEV